jgi:hypothetical protein
MSPPAVLIVADDKDTQAEAQSALVDEGFSSLSLPCAAGIMSMIT